VGTKRSSLVELRIRAAASKDPVALRRIHAELQGDPRLGAQALAEGLERRLAKMRRERRRVSRLFAHRRSLFARGLRLVAGVDEVGVGPLAGPVVAAAVILPERVHLPGLDDSKKLTARAREELDVAIREQAFAVGIGEADVPEIDRINILQATLLAMRRAVASLGAVPEHVLVDARTIPGVAAPQTALVGGDGRDGSIAAASIVAKVHRDALMRRLDEIHPGYGLARHMGYGTAEHLLALRRLGPTEVHRRSFQPVRDATCRAPHAPSVTP
jgi:ribonuclease HII